MLYQGSVQKTRTDVKKSYKTKQRSSNKSDFEAAWFVATADSVDG